MYISYIRIHIDNHFTSQPRDTFLLLKLSNQPTLKYHGIRGKIPALTKEGGKIIISHALTKRYLAGQRNATMQQSHHQIHSARCGRVGPECLEDNDLIDLMGLSCFICAKLAMLTIDNHFTSQPRDTFLLLKLSNQPTLKYHGIRGKIPALTKEGGKIIISHALTKRYLAGQRNATMQQSHHQIHSAQCPKNSSTCD